MKHEATEVLMENLTCFVICHRNINLKNCRLFAFTSNMNNTIFRFMNNEERTQFLVIIWYFGSVCLLIELAKKRNQSNENETYSIFLFTRFSFPLKKRKKFRYIYIYKTN